MCSPFCSHDCRVASRWHSRVTVDDGIAKLVLRDGAVVSYLSERDAAWAAKYPWHLDTQGYAHCTALGRLHRVLMGNPPGLPVDHINQNKLDNRRENLRVATATINVRNCSKARRDSSTGIRGVTWDRFKRKYVVWIRAGRKARFVGRFKSVDMARAARLLAEEEFWGAER